MKASRRGWERKENQSADDRSPPTAVPIIGAERAVGTSYHFNFPDGSPAILVNRKVLHHPSSTCTCLLKLLMDPISYSIRSLLSGPRSPLPPLWGQ